MRFVLIGILIAAVSVAAAFPVQANELNRDQKIKDFHQKSVSQMIGEVRLGEKHYNVVLLAGSGLEQQIGIFNAFIKKNNRPGEFVTCKDAVGLPIGKMNGNWSYGAFCLYEKDGELMNVLVCRGESLERFFVESTRRHGPYNVLQVIIYTVNNCHPRKNKTPE